MKTKWTVVSPHTGMDEDAPANNAGSGNVSMPPDAIKKKKKTLIDRSMMDARTKAYKEHRKKLESSRAVRLLEENGSRYESRRTRIHFFKNTEFL